MKQIKLDRFSSQKTSKIEIEPKKSLGQNFLVDENIARKIVSSMKISPDDVVVEIGPGQGALTKYILGSVSKLFAIEIDKRASEKLMTDFPSKKLAVVNQDILDFDFRALYKKHKKKFRLVGNLPYHLTSSILFFAIDNRAYISDFTFMIQKEVAQRIASDRGTKNYGILSVLLQFYGKPHNLFDVSQNCFYPKPRVTSSVMQLEFFDKPAYPIDERMFKILVKTTFGKRRKTMKNSLQYLPFEETSVKTIIDTLDFDLQKRPEQLSVHDFANITHQISKIINLKN
jgi:16S rRNA (adenine1518-N6/adenine1519-N6)-dimethyltransferase